MAEGWGCLGGDTGREVRIMLNVNASSAVSMGNALILFLISCMSVNFDNLSRKKQQKNVWPSIFSETNVWPTLFVLIKSFPIHVCGISLGERI